MFCALREIKHLKMRIGLEWVSDKAALCHSDSISNKDATLSSLSIPHFLLS